LLLPSDKLYSKILVGIDGSSDSMRAVDKAMAIAKQNEAKLLVLHISPAHFRIGSHSSDMATPSSPEYSKQTDEDVEKWFETIKLKANAMNLSLETRVISSGYSVGEIMVDLADKENVDLIVVGTRGTTGFKKLLLGSVALEVVTYSYCSVLVIK
jgi:nucleotide-binding universal stress UspA family protein